MSFVLDKNRSRLRIWPVELLIDSRDSWDIQIGGLISLPNLLPFGIAYPVAIVYDAAEQNDPHRRHARLDDVADARVAL